MPTSTSLDQHHREPRTQRDPLKVVKVNVVFSLPYAFHFQYKYICIDTWESRVLLRTSCHIYTSRRLLGRPHHVPDDDTVEKKVTGSVEKARTGMRIKDPRLAQHCTRTWALPSPRGRPRRRICSCPSSAESGVSTQRVRAPEDHREPRPLAPAASSARPRDSSPATRPAGCGTASGTPAFATAPMGTRVRRSRHPASRPPSSTPTTPT